MGGTTTGKKDMPWFRVAGVSGAIAVGLGAWGAHSMKLKNEAFKETFKTASLYHFVHTLAILGVASSPLLKRQKLIINGLFSFAIIVFCGSCYASAVAENKKYGSLAPIGGMSFIAGWLALAVM